MGSYGIGIGRILSAIIEQKSDENGLVLPIDIAPYKVAIILINDKDERQVENANRIYEELNNQGIEVVLDDRDERPGVKFKDMDLIGVPVRITVGKKINEEKVELKLRREKESKDIKTADILETVLNIIAMKKK